MTAPLFPAFVDLRGRTVLVVGGGAVAARKVAPCWRRARAFASARRRWARRLQALLEQQRIEYLAGEFEAEWLAGAWLVVAATDDDAVNRAVAAAGEAQRIWVNVVDDAKASSCAHARAHRTRPAAVGDFQRRRRADAGAPSARAAGDRTRRIPGRPGRTAGAGARAHPRALSAPGRTPAFFRRAAWRSDTGAVAARTERAKPHALSMLRSRPRRGRSSPAASRWSAPVPAMPAC